MTVKQTFATLIMLCLLLNACFFSSRPSVAPLPDLTGQWYGTVQDSVSGGGTLSLDLQRYYKEKEGKPFLRGNWRLSFTEVYREGVLKGDGAQNGLRLELSSDSSCFYDLEASVINGVIKGTYRTIFCTPYAIGTLELERQPR